MQYAWVLLCQHPSLTHGAHGTHTTVEWDEKSAHEKFLQKFPVFLCVHFSPSSYHHHSFIVFLLTATLHVAVTGQHTLILGASCHCDDNVTGEVRIYLGRCLYNKQGSSRTEINMKNICQRGNGKLVWVALAIRRRVCLYYNAWAYLAKRLPQACDIKHRTTANARSLPFANTTTQSITFNISKLSNNMKIYIKQSRKTNVMQKIINVVNY